MFSSSGIANCRHEQKVCSRMVLTTYNFTCEWRYSVCRTVCAVQSYSTQHLSHFVQIRRTYTLRVIFRIYLLRSPLEKYTKVYQLNAKPVILEHFTACVGLLQTGELCGNVAADKDFVQTSFYVSNAQCGFGIFRFAYATH